MRFKSILLALLLLSQAAQTAESDTELHSTMSEGDRLLISGRAKPGMLLGLSFYSKKGEVRHQLYPLSSQKFTKRVSVWSRFQGGTYQVALWDRRVYAASCSNKACPYCPKYGYHLEGLSANSSGSLHSSSTSIY